MRLKPAVDTAKSVEVSILVDAGAQNATTKSSWLAYAILHRLSDECSDWLVRDLFEAEHLLHAATQVLWAVSLRPTILIA